MSADDRNQAGTQHMTLMRFQRNIEPVPVPVPASASASASDASGSAGLAPAWLADGKYAWAATLMIWAMLLTFIVPSALFSGEVHDLVANEPSPFYRALKFALIGASALILVWRCALAGRLLRELNVFFPAFLALILLSLMWSIDPAFTLWRSVLEWETALVCAAFVMVAWHPRRLQEVLRPALTGFLVASLIFGALEPNLGREFGDTLSLAGSWRGVFAQKNGLGNGATLGAVFCLHAWLAKEMRFWHFAAGLGVCIACLLLSRSSTALFALIFSASLLFLLMKGFSGRRRYIVPLVILFAALILFYSLVVLKILPDLDFLLQPFVALTGKDMTFTGRAQIWDVVREHIKLHPLLGTGYNAYWIGPVPGSPSILTMARYSDYYPGEAHNGYLDVINDLGYVGLICLLGYILVFLRQSLVLLRADYSQGVLYLSLLFVNLITNLTDSNWFNYESLNFVVTVLVVFALARAALDRRMRAAPAVRPPPLPTPRMTFGGSLPRPGAR
jgi:exopolysaccharide production protein ExoQ